MSSEPHVAKLNTALVVAGSTVGRLDAVRYVEQVSYLAQGEPKLHHGFLLDSQNPFKGKLGLRIAEALQNERVETTLLTRLDLLKGETHSLAPERLRGFFTFQDLEQALPRVIEEVAPDIIFMAAAVSDYVPTAIHGVSEAAQAGKISSDLGKLVVEFSPTPKLLDRIRPLVGWTTTIVGFKLLVNVSEEALRDAALRQMVRADTDFCVGNDFGEMNAQTNVHPVRLYNKAGDFLRYVGSKEEVAVEIVREVAAGHEATKCFHS